MSAMSGRAPSSSSAGLFVAAQARLLWLKSGTRSDPSTSSVANCDHDCYSNFSSFKKSGRPNQLVGVRCHHSLFRAFPRIPHLSLRHRFR
jgi:hypothetical protein